MSREDLWEFRASCRIDESKKSLKGSPFVTQSKFTVNEMIEFSQTYCRKCPVIVECGDSANGVDFATSVRGGLVPGYGYPDTDYMDRRRVYRTDPSPGSHRSQIQSGRCRRGFHDILSFDDLDGNNCKLCLESGYLISNKAKTHCKYGHKLEGENLKLVTRDGTTRRVCIECRRARKRKSWKDDKMQG